MECAMFVVIIYLGSNFDHKNVNINVIIPREVSVNVKRLEITKELTLMKERINVKKLVKDLRKEIY